MCRNYVHDKTPIFAGYQTQIKSCVRAPFCWGLSCRSSSLMTIDHSILYFDFIEIIQYKMGRNFHREEKKERERRSKDSRKERRGRSTCSMYSFITAIPPYVSNLHNSCLRRRHAPEKAIRRKIFLPERGSRCQTRARE